VKLKSQAVLALILGAMLLATACGGGSGSDGTTRSVGKGDASVQDGKGGNGGQGVNGGSRISRPAVTVSPGDGASGVGTKGDLKVTAAKGELVSVVVKNTDGDEVHGEISADGTGWKTDETLTTDTRWTRWPRTAKDAGPPSTPTSPRSSPSPPSSATSPRKTVRRSASGWRCR
jgi:hypothetical protein